jgi:hypothetical protein
VIDLTLDEFLDGLPWAGGIKAKLRAAIDNDEIVALSAYEKRSGELGARAWGEIPDPWPAGTTALYRKPTLTEEPVQEKSRTMQAVDLVEHSGLTVYAAAKQVKVNAAAVHRALARREGREVCPCCQQVVREGFAVDRSVLKASASRR